MAYIEGLDKLYEQGEAHQDELEAAIAERDQARAEAAQMREAIIAYRSSGCSVFFKI